MLRWTIPQAVLQNIWKDSFRCRLIRWSQYLSGGCLKGQLICYAQISTVRCLYSPSQLRKTHFEGRFRVQGPLHSPYTEPSGTRSGTIVKNHIQSRSTLTQWPAFLCSEYDTSLTNCTIISTAKIFVYTKIKLFCIIKSNPGKKTLSK